MELNKYNKKKNVTHGPVIAGHPLYTDVESARLNNILSFTSQIALVLLKRTGNVILDRLPVVPFEI